MSKKKQTIQIVELIVALIASWAVVSTLGYLPFAGIIALIWLSRKSE